MHKLEEIPRNRKKAHTTLLGSPALVPCRDGPSKLIFTHHVFAARFREGMESWKLFVYFLLLQESFRQRATGFATGTTVLALPRDAVLNLEFPAAPQELVTAFDSTASAIVQRQWGNTEQSRTLATLRDKLLPKLISGDLRVRVSDARLTA
jgi:type I restriction enzyme S subunit